MIFLLKKQSKKIFYIFLNFYFFPYFKVSKFTFIFRILSDSMTGKSKIWLIICISPSISSHAETLSTLNFANSAKRAILDGREVNKNKLEATILASEEIKIFKEAYEKVFLFI